MDIHIHGGKPGDKTVGKQADKAPQTKTDVAGSNECVRGPATRCRLSLDATYFDLSYTCLYQVAQ